MMSYFIVFMSSHIKPEPISSYLSGICNQLKNFFPGVHEVQNSPLVNHTLKGCKILKGSTVKRKAPLSPDDIHHTIKTLGSSSHHNDCLFLTLLITGFNGLLWLAELSMPDAKRAHNWRKITCRTTVEWLPEGYTFFLPAHKVDTVFESNKVIIPSNNDPGFNPLPIFRQYLTLCDTRHIVHPLYGSPPLALYQWGPWFMKRLQQVFPSTSIVGQSMHAVVPPISQSKVSPTLLDPRSRQMVLKSLQIYIQKNPVLLQAMIDTRALSL